MSKLKTLVLAGFLASAVMAPAVASDIADPTEQKVSYQIGSTDPNPFEFEGFGTPEGHGRWSLGKEAKFSFPAVTGDRRVSKVGFTFDPFCTEAHPQEIGLVINDESCGEVVFKVREIKTFELDIADDIPGRVTFKFLLPNACLPSVIDPAITDPRHLVMSLHQVVLTSKLIAAQNADSDDESLGIADLFDNK